MFVRRKTAALVIGRVSSVVSTCILHWVEVENSLNNCSIKWLMCCLDGHKVMPLWRKLIQVIIILDMVDCHIWNVKVISASISLHLSRQKTKRKFVQGCQSSWCTLGDALGLLPHYLRWWTYWMFLKLHSTWLTYDSCQNQYNFIKMFTAYSTMKPDFR